MCAYLTCAFLPASHHVATPSAFQLFCLCVFTHVCVWVCLSQGFPDDLVHCGRGVIKDQGQRPFPFPWEDEWPCLKVAAYGLRAIRVCCEPATLTALCTKAGPWEKEKYSAHNPFCWSQHSTVMANKLNAFSFSVYFFPSFPAVPSCSRHPPARFPFLHKPEEKKNVLTTGGPLRKAHRGCSFKISIFDLGDHLACGFGPTSWLWGSCQCNLSTALKEGVNSGTNGLFAPLVFAFILQQYCR